MIKWRYLVSQKNAQHVFEECETGSFLIFVYFATSNPKVPVNTVKVSCCSNRLTLNLYSQLIYFIKKIVNEIYRVELLNLLLEVFYCVNCLSRYIPRVDSTSSWMPRNGERPEVFWENRGFSKCTKICNYSKQILTLGIAGIKFSQKWSHRCSWLWSPDFHQCWAAMLTPTDSRCHTRGESEDHTDGKAWKGHQWPHGKDLIRTYLIKKASWVICNMTFVGFCKWLLYSSKNQYRIKFCALSTKISVLHAMTS